MLAPPDRHGWVISLHVRCAGWDAPLSRVIGSAVVTLRGRGSGAFGAQIHHGVRSGDGVPQRRHRCLAQSAWGRMITDTRWIRLVTGMSASQALASNRNP